jgi:uncharacterized paraquat-inducible protein A
MMDGLVSKFLAVVLAVVMAGSTGVCACASAGTCGMMVQRKEAKPACHHCGKADAKKGSSKSSQQQSCPSCRMTNMADRPAVSQEHAAAMHFLAVAIMPAPLPVGMGLVQAVIVGTREGIPRPPLLCDLFHSSCLLTI